MDLQRTRIWNLGMAGEPEPGEAVCMLAPKTGVGGLCRKCGKREYRTWKMLSLDTRLSGEKIGQEDKASHTAWSILA